ncbi:MAG: hypothetical protein A2912_04900 [Candidatus Buchananbacteria bacterium RIFCSPLOWO2_01_FULL_40_23b]|uniref:Uncharacterized protein n=1 Tax=Candidatus Buchananbacteria bacterium RIFCSPLOWO2_01_FULL_40_23b TaxID=1797544 RepID=A0A1G1YNJ2_9BACT|nr:MAG: hypothetical protein A2912_04900 [Candidatus Buchananbacteria bacterium RIFCSPLOWO2_01_FULL_40_23b]
MTQPKTMKEDAKVTQLKAEGWKWSNNYDPRDIKSLVNALTVSTSFFYHPNNAREVLLSERAYDLFGNRLPEHRAVYLRDCRTVEEQKEEKGLILYIPRNKQ